MKEDKDSTKVEANDNVTTEASEKSEAENVPGSEQASEESGGARQRPAEGGDVDKVTEQSGTQSVEAEGEQEVVTPGEATAGTQSVEAEGEQEVASTPEDAGGKEELDSAAGSEKVSGPVVDKIGADDEQEPEQEESVDPVARLQEDNKKLREQVLRKAADLDNFRKRSRKEIQDARVMAKAELLRDLLPVFDNLERASDHAEQAEDTKAVAEGVKLVLKQFHDTLGKAGVERVKSVGVEFDPNVHEAIQQIESTEYEAGTVAAEVLGGYRMGERLIRAAMVVVAKAPAPVVAAVEGEDEDEEEGGATSEAPTEGESGTDGSAPAQQKLEE